MKYLIKKQLLTVVLAATMVFGVFAPAKVALAAGTTASATATESKEVQALKTYKGNTTTFNAYDYYINNVDLQTAIGADGDALLKHYNEHGKAEGRVAIAATTTASETTTSTAGTASKGTKSNGGNGFDTYNIPSQQQTEASYVLNTNTKKFHYPSCNDVKKIKPENYATSSLSRDDIIAQGYSSCGHCHP